MPALLTIQLVDARTVNYPTKVYVVLLAVQFVNGHNSSGNLLVGERIGNYPFKESVV